MSRTGLFSATRIDLIVIITSLNRNTWIREPSTVEDESTKPDSAEKRNLHDDNTQDFQVRNDVIHSKNRRNYHSDVYYCGDMPRNEYQSRNDDGSDPINTNTDRIGYRARFNPYAKPTGDPRNQYRQHDDPRNQYCQHDDSRNQYRQHDVSRNQYRWKGVYSDQYQQQNGRSGETSDPSCYDAGFDQADSRYRRMHSQSTDEHHRGWPVHRNRNRVYDRNFGDSNTRRRYHGDTWRKIPDSDQS